MLTINHILYLLVFIAIFFYLLKINRLLYYYLFTCMILVGFLVTKDFKLSISIAGIITALIYVYLDKQIPLRYKKSTIRDLMTSVSQEDFKSGRGKKKTKKAKVEKFADSDAEDDEEEEESPKKKKQVEVDSDNDSEQEDFEPTDNKINAKESFQTVIKSLNPQEISSLNNDTKELINTQKQLMETLQSMGPALKEGKTILDTFKNYFNDSNLDKLSM